MYRYINAEQIIGATFKELLSKDRKELSIDDLFKISENLNHKTRKDNNAVIRMSINQIYNVIDDYSSFFCIEDDVIKLSSAGYKSYKEDNYLFMDSLDSYFCAGIPVDIKNTVNKMISRI